MEPTSKVFSNANRAIVTLPAKRGLGVLVPGPFILTACHCLAMEWKEDWQNNTRSPDTELFETVRLEDGKSVNLPLRVAECYCDIAALGEPDFLQMEQDAADFMAFIDSLTPIPLRTEAPLPGESLSVWIRTYKPQWITGKVIHRWYDSARSNGSVHLEADAPIERETSGGLVMDVHGHLVGVVSFPSQGDAGTLAARQSIMPLACLALPRWILDQIAQATKKGSSPDAAPGSAP
jgi:hypothetical protein